MKQLLQYVVLVAITLAAGAVMWWSSSKNLAGDEKAVSPQLPPAVARPKSVVATTEIAPKPTPLVVKHSGKIRSWENYSLGFEIGGRIQELGTNDAGQPLDDGDRVKAGQMLARIDNRVLRARRAEATAQLEQAISDMRQARNLRDRGTQYITESEYQEFLTKEALAKAQLEVANKNLEDAVLVSPVDGAIARRMVEPGESVNPNEVVFEIVQNDEVLLVVNVPEARVRELEMRKRQVERERAGAPPGEAPKFDAIITLEGRDVFGRRWPTINAEVYRIAQLADQMTGLFEVEIRIPNDDRLLRSGMVASANIVTDVVNAYSVPESAVLFRGRDAYLFTVQSSPEPLTVMFWDLGETPIKTARKITLTQWIDQGDTIVIPSEATEIGSVVIRGQQRLADGQLVRVVEDNNGDTKTNEAPAPPVATATKTTPDVPASAAK